jgi:hypothetical protein
MAKLLSGTEVFGNLIVDTFVTATGNVIGGNVTTVGIMSSTGNATHGNILTAGVVSAIANITGGNIISSGNLQLPPGGYITSPPGTNGNITIDPDGTGQFVVATTTPVVFGNSATVGTLARSGLAIFEIDANIAASGTTAWSQLNRGTIANTTTLQAGGIESAIAMGASANISQLWHFYANPGAAGAVSNITGSHAGFYADSNISNIGFGAASTTGNSYGFYSALNANIANTFAFYGGGNAPSYFGGNILTGGIVSSTGNISATANIIGGNILTGGIVSSTGNISATANIIGGNILTGGIVSSTGNATHSSLTVGAGNATVAAINMTTGALLTTPAAGAFEYVGNTIYFDTAAGNRNVIPAAHYYRLAGNVTLSTAVTTAQPWLGVGVQLQGNTTYSFNGLFNLVTTGVTSHTEAIGFGGTATITNIGYVSTRANANAITATTGNQYVVYHQSNASTVQTGAFTTAQNCVYQMSGTVSINAAGNFTPTFSFSAAPTGAATVVTGSYFQIFPIGQGTGNLAIGNWA